MVINKNMKRRRKCSMPCYRKSDAKHRPRKNKLGILISQLNVLVVATTLASISFQFYFVTLFIPSSYAFPSTDVDTNSTSSPFFKYSVPFPLDPSTTIDDATCDVKQLEEANDSQLHSILKELKGTAFFRYFEVDLDHGCPIATLVSTKKVVHTDSSTKLPAASPSPISSKNSPIGTTNVKKNYKSSTGSSFNKKSIFRKKEDDGSKCASEGLPEADPDAKPACALNLNDAGDSGFSSFLQFKESEEKLSSTTISKETMKARKTAASLLADDTSLKQKETTLDYSPKIILGNKEAGLKDQHSDCTGGSIADELDDDSPSLCQLKEEIVDLFAFQEPPFVPDREISSSVLNAISSKPVLSETEKETFQWSDQSDPVVTSTSNELEPCNDDDKNHEPHQLHETFWLDMCSNIKAGDGVKVVNLDLNPHRNTGYNGTHIWNAIYEENCIGALDGISDQPMCYEERVLYRLLSGLHASTTLSIAKSYFPPSKLKKRVNWEPSVDFFWEKFESHPDHIRNLHFTYVVLLRALKKASPFLYDYEIRTGNTMEDETASILLKRLLDSTILRSCSNVFDAFDESLMFRDQQNGFERDKNSQLIRNQEITLLQQNFKGVFHNISSILDCVQCTQCKLHGKLSMLGFGTALKILFLPREELIALERNEVVALINSVAKLSESIKEVRELTVMYWKKIDQLPKKEAINTQNEIKPIPPPVSAAAKVLSVQAAKDPFDAAVGMIATLARNNLINDEREAELIQMALARNSDVLTLAKYYVTDLNKFFFHSQNIGFVKGEVSQIGPNFDAIVIGSGLAGLSATLHLLDRGGKVLVIEKEHLLGGNSNKASSGINACCPSNSTTDFIESFKSDTIKSAGDASQLPLIETLIGNSAAAVTWLKERVGVDLSLLAQLGGHEFKRTHRPSNGMVGAEVIYGMQKAVKAYEKSGMVKILMDTKVVNVSTDKNNHGHVTGVEVAYLAKPDKNNNQLQTHFESSNVVLATGGFAADRSSKSYLAKYRSELLKMPATAGQFSTGDGIGLATKLGAGLIDMEKIQIHPTGWVNPEDPKNPNKVLAAELMRGVGGILINAAGKRFCNELGTRAYVTDKMLGHNEQYLKTKKWNQENDVPTFYLVLSTNAANAGRKHVDHYIHKGLVKKVEGVVGLADLIGQDVSIIRKTLEKYRIDSQTGKDIWGKTSFQGVSEHDIATETFYVGTVTPVLHYCMGGITIDTEGNVINENGNPIPGLHAAGEVAGGVHGNNRLGGNSLLECTVYGTIVGNKIPINKRIEVQKVEIMDAVAEVSGTREVSLEELATHHTPEDCWVGIHGCVYDLTEFAEEHPAGAQSILKLGGQDGTEAFQTVHSKGLMDDFEELKIGKLK